MKTPMMELIEQLKAIHDCFTNVSIEASLQIHTVVMLAESLLEKEKAVIIDAVKQGWDYNEEGLVQWMGEKYYNETFNTKEK